MFCKIKIRYIDEKQAKHNYMLHALREQIGLCPSLKHELWRWPTMWTRELLKTNAKQALQGRYWRSFWICLVLSFVGLGGAGEPTAAMRRGRLSALLRTTRRPMTLSTVSPTVCWGDPRRYAHRLYCRALLGTLCRLPAQRRPLPLFYGEPPVPDARLHRR